ncbi:MAG: thiamine pyrophosphate-dependent enzyme, partial [Spirochaetota bacterium]
MVEGSLTGPHRPGEEGVLSILGPDGKLQRPGKEIPLLDDRSALSAYRSMVLAREADDWAVSLNRQGRLGTYPPNRGQEACSVGGLTAVRPDDWFVPAFRELGGYIARGIPLERYYLYWYGNEIGSRLAPETYRTMPLSIPVGSQALHAVGIARAERHLGSSRIALCFMGDGATSQGEVAEAFNLAGLWKAPAVFFIQNNRWAISVPVARQTASGTLADKALAYGFEGIRVDGNDLFAVYAAVFLAARRARAGEGPTLVEGLTYRMGAHTTSDDPARYRPEEEVVEWEKKDPIARVEAYLTAGGLLTGEGAARIRKEASRASREAFRRAESLPDPGLEEVFAKTFR